MKIKLMAVCALALATMSCGGTNSDEPKKPGTTPAQKEYELWWSDEFDVDGAPNEQYWNFENGFARNHEDQWYQKENASIKDGILTIECRKERKPNPWYQAGSSDWKKQRQYIEYTSTSMTTCNKKHFTFGRLEVRAKIPTAGGAWPAIWLLGYGYDWPSCGEIDVMEYYRGMILANTCHGNNTPWQGVWNSMSKPLKYFTDSDPEWVNKFHVWRMDWDAKAIRIYIDDKLIQAVNLTTTINGTIGQSTNPFHSDQYVLLNLALGGDNGGTIDNNAFPMKYEIDYVRIYKEKPAQQ